jgi:subtilisin-like proprotein convertase family protein
MHLEEGKWRIPKWGTNGHHGTFRSWQIHTYGYHCRIHVSCGVTRFPHTGNYPSPEI